MHGDDIRRWRSANRVKQAALASMLGVSHAAVSQWENGIARPSKSMALRLAEVMSGAHEGRLAAEIAFTAPQHQAKALMRGRNLQLLAVSAGYRAAWPDMVDFIGQDMSALLLNEGRHYATTYLTEASRGDLLMVSGVSNQILALGGDAPADFRLRWHVMARRIDGELVHEIVFEPCAAGTPVGFEHVLWRDDITAARDDRG